MVNFLVLLLQRRLDVIAARLRDARKQRGHTLQQAAAEIGVDTKTVWAWEREEGDPNASSPRGLSRRAVDDYIRRAGTEGVAR